MDAQTTGGKKKREGYFKVSIEAARAIAKTTNSTELLASYVVLCCHAFGKRGAPKSNRDHTVAGAKAIRETLGLTDYRSKKLVAQLRGEGFGPEGNGSLFEPAGFTVGNADAYRIKEWGEQFAYLPSLACRRKEKEGDEPPLIASLLDDSDNPDALLFLLYAYEQVRYGDWFGCNPHTTVYQLWSGEGDGFGSGMTEDFYPLGHQGKEAGFDFWLFEEPGSDAVWHVPKAASELFDQDVQRAVNAVAVLLARSALVRVAYCFSKPASYPLWVFNPSYRESLAELGIEADLARAVHRAANRLWVDADNRLSIEANGLAGTEGTGFFYCTGQEAKVYTLVMPRLHAPTPKNMDELKEASVVTKRLAKALSLA